jgi:hypothetical protein
VGDHLRAKVEEVASIRVAGHEPERLLLATASD